MARGLCEGLFSLFGMDGRKSLHFTLPAVASSICIAVDSAMSCPFKTLYSVLSVMLNFSANRLILIPVSSKYSLKFMIFNVQCVIFTKVLAENSAIYYSVVHNKIAQKVLSSQTKGKFYERDSLRHLRNDRYDGRDDVLLGGIHDDFQAIGESTMTQEERKKRREHIEKVRRFLDEIDKSVREVRNTIYEMENEIFDFEDKELVGVKLWD